MIINYEMPEGAEKANELCVGLKMTHGIGSANLRRWKVEKALKLQKKLFDASDKIERVSKQPSALDNIVLRPNQEAFV